MVQTGAVNKEIIQIAQKCFGWSFPKLEDFGERYTFRKMQKLYNILVVKRYRV